MSMFKSFEPSIDNNSTVLILGLMLGVKSLEEQQCYAHPQNRFWKLLAYICQTPNLLELKYNEKIEILLAHNIALWDTIKFCKRGGSLDSNILNVIPNNIKGLLKSIIVRINPLEVIIGMIIMLRAIYLNKK